MPIRPPTKPLFSSLGQSRQRNAAKTQHALPCREALQALIPAMLGAQGAEEEGDDSLLQGITRGTFQGIMQDRLSSHVMEVCTPLSLSTVHAHALPPPPLPGPPPLTPPRLMISYTLT